MSQLDPQLLLQILDNQPDPVVYYKPVWDASNNITDFKVAFCNNASAVQIKLSKEDFATQHVLGMNNTDEAVRKRMFEQLVHTYNSGKESEDVIYNPVLQKHFRVLRSKLQEGVLSVARNCTREMEERNQKECEAVFANNILDSSLNGIFVCEAIRNDGGEIVDLLMLRVNHAFSQLLNMTEDQVIGKTYLSLFPGSKTQGIFDINCRVIETRVPEKQEMYYKGGDLDAWYMVSLAPLANDQLVVTFGDISQTKNLELQLQKKVNELERLTSFANSILDSSLNGIYTLKAVRDAADNIVDFVFDYSNKRHCEIIGVEEGSQKGSSLHKDYPHTLENGYYEGIVEVVKTGKPQRHELFSTAMNRWYDYTVVKLDDGVAVTWQDITEQKHALAQVHEQKNLLDNILRYSSNGITVSEAIRDEEGRIIDFKAIVANQASELSSGVSAELLLSRPISEIDPRMMQTPIVQQAISTLKTGVSFIQQFYFGAGERWLEITVSKMDDDHLINIFTDVTEIKKTQLQLEQKLTELEHTNHNLQEFAYAASHDLKEPVRKIHFYANRLKDMCAPNVEAPALQYFEKLEAASKRMSLLIDDLLEYSHISITPPVFEAVDLNQKLRVVLSDLELAIQEKDAVINIADMPTVKAHRRQMQQLFQNLLSNAIKYSKENQQPVIDITYTLVKGEEHANSTSHLDPRKAYHLIQVTDNGIGFEQQYSERIFNVFQRLHGKNEYSGTGIGLSIAKKVVQNHGGSITAESEPGMGATFKIYLPAE